LYGILISKKDTVNGSVRAIARLPKINQLASGDTSGTLIFWKDLKVVSRVELNNDPVCSLSAHEDDVLWIGSYSSIKLLNLKTNSILKDWQTYKGMVEQLLLVVNHVWSSSNDCISVWDSETHELKQTLKEHQNRICCFAVTSTNLDDTYVWSSSFDKSICVWNAKTFSICKKMTDHTDYIRALISVNEGTVVSGSGDKKIFQYVVD